jgi:hypothetical protein
MFKTFVLAELRFDQFDASSAPRVRTSVACSAYGACLRGLIFRIMGYCHGRCMMRSAGLWAGLLVGMLAACGGGSGSSTGSLTTPADPIASATRKSAAPMSLTDAALQPAQAARHHRGRANGTCGSSNGAFLVSAPAKNLCESGVASAVTGTGPWAWSCSGRHGGTNSQCSAQLHITGVCGSANGVTLSAPPKTGLCSSGIPSIVSGNGPWTWTCAGNDGSSAACEAQSTVQSTTAQSNDRTVPSPIYGVTLDDVSNVSAKLYALQHLVRMPTARIVLDTGEPASYYLPPLQTLRTAAYIMGELVDSSYMTSYTTSSIQTWTENYTQTLSAVVDIWEVGNEVNGNWLSTERNGADVLRKIETMYDIVAANGAATAITFFYEGEPADNNNCIATDHGGNDMFTWINDRFSMNLPPAQRPVETEKIRVNLNYALISWYPDQCPGENPDWPQVYSRLASIFPNAKVGFGELGTANPQNGSSFETNEINQYYPMANEVAGLPGNYIGGYFWWYFAEEMVPWPGSLGYTLNTAIQ